MSTDADARHWATLTPDALADEIAQNRRSERRLVTIALVALAVTAVLLVARGLW
ncbi:hypothetical protein [Cellulomonas alba]|uniref:Uncharacterized protein n=1 Tax=Cellulomonas alba TaxID=3053467 RepID=A0ABT7SE78_9CELL|nr:hypothetical protein [Cellulomonas alba]MDM7854498.1 hypothetical protein [Cellulomonas alba]